MSILPDADKCMYVQLQQQINGLKSFKFRILKTEEKKNSRRDRSSQTRMYDHFY